MFEDDPTDVPPDSPAGLTDERREELRKLEKQRLKEHLAAKDLTKEELAYIEQILNINKESLELLRKRVENLSAALELEEKGYAKAARRKALAIEQGELDARVLAGWREKLLGGEKWEDLMENATKSEKEKYGHIRGNLAELDRTLNATEQTNDAYKEVNAEIIAGTSLQNAVTKTATKWTVAIAAGVAHQLLAIRAAEKLLAVTRKIADEGWKIANSFDAQTKALERQLQQGPAYGDRIKSNYKALNEFGASMENVTEAERRLTKSVTDYTLMAPAQQDALSYSAALAEQLGVGLEDYALGVQNSMKMMGQSTESAITVQGELAATARALGREQGEFAAEYARSGHALAKFGKQGVKAFKDLQHIAKITGMEMGKVLAITNKFDTFEGAADQAGKLNAALGGNFVNAMDLMMATDPAERFGMIRDSILDAGLSFDDMSYYQKQFYTQSLGLSDTGDLALMLSGRMDLLADSTTKSAESITEQKERAQTLMTLQEAMAAIVANNSEEFLDFAEVLKGAILMIVKAAPVIKVLAQVIFALGSGLTAYFTILYGGMAIQRAWAAMTAITTLVTGKQTVANWLLAASQKASMKGMALLVAGLVALAAAWMIASPSQLVVATVSMGAAVFLLGRMSESSALQVQALAIPMLQLGAAIFLATAGIGLMAAGFANLSGGQMAGMIVIIIGLAIAFKVLSPAIGILGGAAMAVMPGLLTLAAVFLAIGAGIGMAAAGVGMMGHGMALLFDSIDPVKIVLMNVMISSLVASAPLMAVSAGAMVYLAAGMAALGIAMAFLDSKKLMSFGFLVNSLANMGEITHLRAFKKEIIEIINAIDNLSMIKTVTFMATLDKGMKAIETSTETQGQSGVKTGRVTLSEEVIVPMLKFQNAATQAVAVRTAAVAANTQMIAENSRFTPLKGKKETPDVITKVKQPITLLVNDLQMGDFVIEVVGRRIQEINVH